MRQSKPFRKAAAAASLHLFARTYFSEAMFAPSAKFQLEMFRLAEGVVNPLVVAAFRGSAKSFIFTQCYPLFAVMTQKVHFIVIFSGTQQQAEQHLANVRYALERSELLKKDFGPFREESDEWGRKSIVFGNYDAKIMAASVEQSVRGLKYKHWRPYLICDDGEDINSARSHESREKLFHYVQSEIIPLGGPGTRVIIVGNVLHPNSTIMRLKESIESGKMSGVFREYPLQDKDGKIAWPERFTPEVLEAEKKKYADEIDWEREMNLRFVSAPDVVVKPEWIQPYAKLPNGGYVSGFAIGVDPAISKKQTADYSAIVSCVVCNSGDETKLFVYPDPFNERVNFPELVAEIGKRHAILAASMRRVNVYVEDVAYQAAIPQHLESLGDMNVKGIKIPLDKRSRFAVLGHLIAQGRILFPGKGCERLIGQLTGYGKETHDDLVDALAIIAFAAFPNPYPRFTVPSKICWPGKIDLQIPFETNEEILAAFKDPETRKKLDDWADAETTRKQLEERGYPAQFGGGNGRTKGSGTPYKRKFTF